MIGKKIDPGFEREYPVITAAKKQLIYRTILMNPSLILLLPESRSFYQNGMEYGYLRDSFHIVRFTRKDNFGAILTSRAEQMGVDVYPLESIEFDLSSEF